MTVKQVYKVFKKDPGAVLDYGWDLRALSHEQEGAVSDWLESDETVSSFTVTADAGLTVDSSSETDGLIMAWLSGGTASQKYEVSCEFTTSKGRTDVRRVTVEVIER